MLSRCLRLMYDTHSNGHIEELISDALIAELEADIYGLQVSV